MYWNSFSEKGRWEMVDGRWYIKDRRMGRWETGRLAFWVIDGGEINWMMARYGESDKLRVAW